MAVQQGRMLIGRTAGWQQMAAGVETIMPAIH
jgi:hypothetical protein